MPKGDGRKGLLAVGMGLAFGAALIFASLLSSRSDAIPEQTLAPARSLPHVAEVQSILDGVPQKATVLGSSDAPVTLVEYADLQCPYCAQWALGTLPLLVEEYVRAGKVRIEFRGLAFIGPDSETALRAALAAGLQDRLWHMIELLYANQGAENSGWVSEALVERIAADAGLEADELAAGRRSAAVDAGIAKAQAQAKAARVRGTPTFELGRTGRVLRPPRGHLTRVGAVSGRDRAGACRMTGARLLERPPYLRWSALQSPRI